MNWYSGYLILICALLELFKLCVQHSELPGDTLYSCVESPVLTILCVKVVLIALTLLLGADLSVFSAQTYKKKKKKSSQTRETNQNIRWAEIHESNAELRIKRNAET